MIDFRNQTIYYITVERFNRKGPTKNDSLSGELSYSDESKSVCGNLKGIIEKLDYLKELGITTIWLSPVFELCENTEDFESRGSNKYFGYWPENFKQLSRHIVSDEKDMFPFINEDSEIDLLIKKADEKGIRVLLDFVCNYSSKNQRSQKMRINLDNKIISADNNEFSEWYHNYSGEKEEWKNKWQLENQKLCGFPHFNEFNYGYRKYIWDSLKDWLKKGVGGFSINTLKNMPEWFWNEFYSEMKNYNDDIFIFGEWAGGGCNSEDSIKFVNDTSIPIIDFSLRKAVEDALARNNSAGFYLVDDVFRKDGKFKNVNELITCVDCNNFPRFLSINNDYSKFELAINLIITCRGIPFILFGNEQYITDNLNSSQNIPLKEKWDKDSRIFRNIKILTNLRQENIALQRGFQQTRYITDNIFVYHRKYGYNFCVVAMNKGPEKTFDIAGIDIPDGVYTCLLTDKTVIVENYRIIQLCLAENETIVISKYDPLITGQTKVTFQLNGYNTHYGEIVKVIGSCPELGNWNIDLAPDLQYINSNTWMGDVNISESAGKSVFYKYVVFDFDKSVKYESRSARSRVFPAKGHTTWKNIWL